jgi:hypothetical protein
MAEPVTTTFEFADFAITSTEFEDMAYRSNLLSGPTIVNPSSDNGRSLWEDTDDLA